MGKLNTRLYKMFWKNSTFRFYGRRTVLWSDFIFTIYRSKYTYAYVKLAFLVEEKRAERKKALYEKLKKGLRKKLFVENTKKLGRFLVFTKYHKR